MHVLSVLSLASLALAAPGALKRSEPAKLLEPTKAANTKIIDGEYIVKLKDSAKVRSTSTKFKALRSYDAGAFKGFHAKLSDAQLKEVRDDPNVDYVEHNQKIDMYDFLSQEGAPWGITRISHNANGATNYSYDESAGEGVCVYMIDTGIKVDHPDFEGRAEWVQNFTDDGDDADVKANLSSAGHGTWTAGLVASATYGVAKKSKVLALKVFRDDGTTDGASIIDAMNYVVGDTGRDCPSGRVVNMSLGGGFSQASNDAADAMVSSGAFVAVAAGNDNVDAGQTSPASAPTVCTVGATDQNDSKADFSSFGPVLDIWAPGVDLESTSYEGGSTSASGTSGASPIVAGIGAYLMRLEGIAGGEGVCDRIKELSTKDVLQNIPDGSVNQLAFNGAPQ